MAFLSGAFQKRVHFIRLPRVGKPRNDAPGSCENVCEEIPEIKQAYRKHATGTVQNETPGGRKYKQICFKIHLKWLQNGSPEASGRPLGAEPASRAFVAPFGRGSWGALGGSWGLLGSLLAPLGPPKVSPEAPRGSPGGSRRASGTSFWEHFCCKACRHGKSKKSIIFLIC